MKFLIVLKVVLKFIITKNKIMKKEIPMLFSTPMVAALGNGTKTMTRRMKGLEYVNVVPDVFRFVAIIGHPKWGFCARFIDITLNQAVDVRIPYGNAGDRIYVRENFKMVGWDFEDGIVNLEFADGTQYEFDDVGDGSEWVVNQLEKLEDKGVLKMVEGEDRMEYTGKHHPFSPSIHLPKWGSRFWIDIGEIVVERLQDISEQDAISEGVEKDSSGWYKTYGGPDVWGRTHKERTAKKSFQTLWKSINGVESWDKNPWVWVIKFKKVTEHE